MSLADEEIATIEEGDFLTIEGETVKGKVIQIHRVQVGPRRGLIDNIYYYVDDKSLTKEADKFKELHRTEETDEFVRIIGVEKKSAVGGGSKSRRTLRRTRRNKRRSTRRRSTRR